MPAVLLFNNQTDTAAQNNDSQRVCGPTSRRLTVAVLAGLALLFSGSTASAQRPGRYYPLNQNSPPGLAGRWAGLAGKADGGYFQPVSVELPDGGEVTFYGSSAQPPVTSAVPSQVGMLVGHVYRFKISGFERFPGAELYPSVELLDRLHPPRGRAADFPVPVTFSNEEIELALDGRMITKVIYLEQPQLANPIKMDSTVPVDILRPSENPIAFADMLGRPMAIVRLGGRIPLPHGDNHEMLGSGAPIDISQNSHSDAPESQPVSIESSEPSADLDLSIDSPGGFTN